jgi:ERCC4-type nuclease
MDHRTSIVARFASQLPGIGYEKACAVAGYFGTVKEMVNAHPSRWAQIPGIGKGLSTSIVDLLEG